MRNPKGKVCGQTALWSDSCMSAIMSQRCLAATGGREQRELLDVLKNYIAERFTEGVDSGSQQRTRTN